ncbi:hypothetical protein [Methylobacterium brachythecii]|uniref:Uncharacterized protein n=1 Tax=Methylobacterium brachythecii TaxID=1176177 RepID=A0A7W6ALX8_9HYPH|nr:hypothetical protein [Methylobacterium brachythecii]MBB3904164.1 hypothetical protein [Methylobacterium brachythecii]GLS45174.1 hypothetical protein GCM10007884_31630 [Methylobacterium brachythecii]
MDGWQQIAGQLAQIGLPALGGLFGGPLGGTIGGLVGKGVAAALGVEATPQDVSQAIQADPSAASVKLAQIEAETKAREGDLQDLASARNQTIQLAQAGSGIAWGAPVVSIVIGLGFFLVMFMLFFVRAEMPSSVFQLLSILFGVLATLFTQVGNYWLGSSEGSRRNGDAIRGLAQQAVTPSPAQIASQVVNAVRR